jgi:hypothetical protein
VLNRLNQLREFAEKISKKVNREEEQVVDCRAHVQASQRYIQQLQPWIEQGEIYLKKRFDHIGAANVNDAKQLLDKHKVIKKTNPKGNFYFFFRNFSKNVVEC